MTLAQTLNAVAAELIPWLNALSANPDPQSQADATALTRVVNALLTDAMQANALDLETKLADATDAARRLADLTASAAAQAKKLAQDQANVAKFISLATDVGKLLVAGAAGNIPGCATALLSACNDLGITTK